MKHEVFLFFLAGNKSNLGSAVQRFSTAAALEEPIIPPVRINDTQLLINGKFVDSASGTVLLYL